MIRGGPSWFCSSIRLAILVKVFTMFWVDIHVQIRADALKYSLQVATVGILKEQERHGVW